MEDKVEEVIKNTSLIQKVINIFRETMNAIRHVSVLVFSVNFWIIVLVVGNILFFIANFLKPVAEFVDEVLTIGGSSAELMETIHALEESSGVPMEDFIELAVNNVRALRRDVANTELRTQRIETALVNPLILSWHYEIPNEDADCLGGMEMIFRENRARKITSAEAVRNARFIDTAGFHHAFSATCLGSYLAIFVTGYNQAGAEELFSDIIEDVREKWPPNAEPPDSPSDQ